MFRTARQQSRVGVGMKFSTQSQTIERWVKVKYGVRVLIMVVPVFWTKDLRQKKRVLTRYSTESFVATLAEHAPDRYQHSIRYFGLLAPRCKRRTFAALFLLLGQKKRRRPHRLSWRNSLRKYFKVDPLVDRQGQPLRWVGRLKTAKSTPCISSGG